MLGHKDPKMAERYAHLEPDFQDDAIAVLELSQKLGTPQPSELRDGLVGDDQNINFIGVSWRAGEDSNSRPPDS